MNHCYKKMTRITHFSLLRVLVKEYFVIIWMILKKGKTILFLL